MTKRALAATGAGLVLLAGCGFFTDAQRGPVPLAGGEVTLAGPQDLEFEVRSCNGDPVVHELVEEAEAVRILVTAEFVTGVEPDCLDDVQVTLQEPLGDRNVIDAHSDETLRVVPLDADADS